MSETVEENKPKGNWFVGLLTLVFGGYMIYKCIEMFLI